MKRLRHIISLTIILLCAPAISAKLDIHNKELTDSLTELLDNIDSHVEAREKYLKGLKARYYNTAGRVKIESAGSIADCYMLTDLDSASQYYRLALLEARRNGMRDTVTIYQYKYQSLLPAMGVTKEAIEWFENISTAGMKEDIKRAHWLAGSQIYHTSYQLYPQGPLKRAYRLKTRMAIDSLRMYYPPSSSITQYLDALAYLLNDDPNMAAANFINALPGLEKHSELADNAMLHIAQYYKDKPEYYQAYMRFLMQRAIKTLNRGIIRPDALIALAGELKTSGYDSLADRCYNLALSTEEHSYLRVYRHYKRNDLWMDQFNKSRKRSINLSIISIGLLTLLIAAIIVIIRERKKLQKKETELQKAWKGVETAEHDAHLVTDNLIELMFLSAEQLREYNLFVLRKLKAGQTKSLFDEIETGKYQSRMHSRYFQVFDCEFLKTFPDFIDKLNTLLQPDKQLKLQAGDRLTPELRIAAFIRLGVSDSTRIAGALNLSLNTIYTYRNRLRSRAIDRENFDAMLLKIT